MPDPMQLGDIYVPTSDGRFVSQKMQDLTEIIKDYDEWLELKWIPPENRREPGDELEAYAIFDTNPTTDNKPIMFFKETDTPEEILSRLLMGDTSKGDPLKKIDAHNDMRKLMQMKRFQIEMEEAEDQASFLIQSPLNYLKWKTSDGQVVKLDDQRRRVR